MPTVHRRVMLDYGADAVTATLTELLPGSPSFAAVPHAGGEASAPVAYIRGHHFVRVEDPEIPAGQAHLEVTIEPVAGEQRTRVDIRSSVHLDVPFFAWIFRPLVASAQRRRLRHVTATLVAMLAGDDPPPKPRPVPGLPTVRFSRDQATMLSTAAMAAALAGFGAALFGQHADFVGDSFGASDASLGVALAVTRIGAIVSLIATAFADRRGRRILLLITVGGIAVANLASAFAPTLVAFTAFQTLTRGFVNAAFGVAGVAALEEAPEGARGFSTAMIAMAGGLGFSLAVLTLPISDLGVDAWRGAFLLSGASLLLLPKVARLLPESRRYIAVDEAGVSRGQLHELVARAWRRRFVLFALLAFVGSVFNAPSSQLMNKFLSDEHGFSGAGIAGFRAATTAIPGLIGLLVAMRLMETKGRKPVGGIGVFFGHVVQILFFLAGGALLWLSSAGSVLFAAAGSIALGALSAELFPTQIRATSNAVLTVIAVAGSATGLVAAGVLSDQVGGLGNAIALLGIPAVIAVAAIVPFLPEAAGRRLDDISPPSVPFGADP